MLSQERLILFSSGFFLCMLQLDVYNQRLLEKREQQYQELLARKKAEKNKDSTTTPPGIST